MKLSDKTKSILFPAIAGISIALILLFVSTWENNDPSIQQQNAKYKAEEQWYEKQNTLARSTNDTKVLQSIYRDALTHGADPSTDCGFWDDCDQPTYLYKYAKAKYEGLK